MTKYSTRTNAYVSLTDHHHNQEIGSRGKIKKKGKKKHVNGKRKRESSDAWKWIHNSSKYPLSVTESSSSSFSSSSLSSPFVSPPSSCRSSSSYLPAEPTEDTDNWDSTSYTDQARSLVSTCSDDPAWYLVTCSDAGNRCVDNIRCSSCCRSSSYDSGSARAWGSLDSSSALLS